MPRTTMPPNGWITHSEQIGKDALTADAWRIVTELASGVRIVSLRLPAPPPAIIDAIERIAAAGRRGVLPPAFTEAGFSATKFVGVDSKFDPATPIFATSAVDKAGLPLCLATVSTAEESALTAHANLVKAWIDGSVMLSHIVGQA